MMAAAPVAPDPAGPFDVRHQEMAVLLGVAKGVVAMSTRHRNTRDPVTRFSLLLDKLMLMIDALRGMAETRLEQVQHQTESLRAARALTDAQVADLRMGTAVYETMHKALAMVDQDLGEMWDWIQQPSLAPDHPYGHAVMQASHAHFVAQAAAAGTAEAKRQPAMSMPDRMRADGAATPLQQPEGPRRPGVFSSSSSSLCTTAAAASVGASAGPAVAPDLSLVD